MTVLPALDTPPAKAPRPGRDAGRPDAAPVALATVAGLLQGLDGAQRRAVTHGEGPLLIAAGPGCGKTRVLTTRIAWLVATKRARPAEILALTFSERAAAEVQGRVDELVPYGQADTAVETFHALGDRLVRDHVLELGLPAEPRVLSRAAAIGFVRARLFDVAPPGHGTLADPARAATPLADHLARLKDEDVSPARYAAYAARLQATAGANLAAAADETARQDGRAGLEEAAVQVWLARAYEAYQALLAAAGCLDFGDQIGLAVRLLEERAAVRRAVRERYRYVLVDEFQDTNPAQLRLLRLLVGQTGNLTAVGDDDQAIYGFRGADRGLAGGAMAAWPTARTIALCRNYRSRRPILAAADRLIGHNDSGTGLPRRRLVAHRRARPLAIACHGFATADAEAAWVARTLAERAAAGRPLRSMAILVRANRDARPFLQALAAAGVPAASGGGGLLARPEVRQLAAFLRAIGDPASDLDLYALATADPYRLGGPDLTDLLATARRRHRSLWEVLTDTLDQPGLVRVAAATRQATARLVEDVRAACELAHRRPATEVLYDHLRRTGRLAHLAAQPDGDAAVAAVARFFARVRDQLAVLPDDRLAFLLPELEVLLDDHDDGAPGEGPLDTPDAVAVLTVHKAKGLEFGLVVVAGLADGRFPARGRAAPFRLPPGLLERAEPDGGGAEPHAEERRLAYVAMTRARDELILTWAERAGGRRAYRPSPFLAEALDGPVPRPLPAPELVPLVAAPPVAPGVEAGHAAPRELSFSQLDCYLACPRRYRYRHVVGLPEPPHHALVYGSALHAAVAAYHLSERRGRPLDEDALQAVFADHWRSEGFLSRAHEDGRFAAGQAALRRFRAQRLDAGDPAPAAVEATFSVMLGGDRLRGRYDRVDRTGHGTVITDYKSSEVHDPRRARQRARDSLQLALYALAYEAQAGQLPAAVQLHFLSSGLVGAVVPDAGRLERARQRLAGAAAGIREGRFEATPDAVTCAGCPFREICPSSAA